MTHKLLFFISLIALIVTPTSGEAQNSQEEDTRKQSIEKIRSEVKRRDVPIKFYGLVVDQYGDPVENAEVEFNIRQYSFLKIYGTKNIKDTTDKNGRVNLSGFKGNSLFVRDIKKQGFKFKAGNKCLIVSKNKSVGRGSIQKMKSLNKQIGKKIRDKPLHKNWHNMDDGARKKFLTEYS